MGPGAGAGGLEEEGSLVFEWVVSGWDGLDLSVINGKKTRKDAPVLGAWASFPLVEPGTGAVAAAAAAAGAGDGAVVVMVGVALEVGVGFCWWPSCCCCCCCCPCC